CRALPFAPLPTKGRHLSFEGYVAIAGVAELVDALDLGSSIARCGGSSPFARTSFRPSASAPPAGHRRRRTIMQIVETSNEGLKRAYTVTFAAADITAR